MKIINENLFFIEFGEPQVPNSYSILTSSHVVKPIYVVAFDYSGAEKKASEYLNEKLEKLKPSVLTTDGSLNSNMEIPPCKIISVKLISEGLIY